ncbi:MAG: sensor domain-containing diguanylate cyclase [Kiloniellaceae bacterium]
MVRSPATSGPPSEAKLLDGQETPTGQNNPSGLSSAGVAFDLFPGAVLMAGPNGIVLDANDLADPIGQILRSGQHEELRTAIQAALGGTAAQVNPLVVATKVAGRSVEHAYDVVVLPWADGTVALLLGRDITLERSLRAALVESRQRYKDLVEISNDFSWETDADGRFAFVSPRGALGYEAAELVGRAACELLLDGKSSGPSPFTARTVVEDAEIWVCNAEGAEICLLSTVQPLHSHSGEWIGVRGVCRDITSLRCQEVDLAEARNRERLFSYIVNMVRRELEPARMLSATAEALLPALALAGISIHALVKGSLGQKLAQAGKPVSIDGLKAVLPQLSIDQQMVDISTGGGNLLLCATRFRDGTNGLLCAWRDGDNSGWTTEDRSLFGNISGQVGLAIEQLARQTEMETLSMTDPLTGLHNRRGFVESLEELLAGAATPPSSSALFYIDLDNFKQVNDTHGHQTGDEALLEVAALLKQQIRTGDLAARLGGDEFALFLGGMERPAAESKGEQLLRAAERLRGFSGDRDHPLGLSLGIAVFDPRTRESLESLLRRADEAMYGAKRGGKNRLSFASSYDRRAG